MQNKIQKWNRKFSIAGLVLVLTALLTALVPMLGAAGGTTTVTGNVNVNNVCTFSESNTVILFGGAAGLNAGTNTIGTSKNNTWVTDTGQSTSNILIYTGSWSWNTPTGSSVSNTIYSSASNVLWGPIASVAVKTNGAEVQMAATQVDTGITVNTVGANVIWLGLSVPSTTPGGSYTSTISLVSSC
jgi:hypothetical protein